MSGSSNNDDPVITGQTGERRGNDFLIVGIGASAGGIKAFKEFFERVPADSGIAYVVILHLSPDHDSKLAEVLQASAAIPVAQVVESIKIEPNHVYVIPPDKSLSIKDGTLALSEIKGYEERRAPVDIFFRTLAQEHGPRAVSVILSGTGANGSMGIKRVKEMGGIILVQDPREAEYSDMPRNSIATGLVDYVLPVAEIPAKIIAYKENLKEVSISTEAPERQESDEQALRDIFTRLRVGTRHDFSNYKRATVLRRIERRINVHELASLPDYARFMRDHREEAQALLKDLLISVTNFFRDPETFAALEQSILPKLFEGKEANDHVRVWVAGCATGEEAYSLAMLLADYAAKLIAPPKIQVFASDIDEQAVAVARDGFYTDTDVADVPPERLRRYFVKETGGYRARRELREMVLFAHHNLIKDPPFSHLDMASCRNLLIYLNRGAQERVMQVMHFALSPGGYLFLGTSESVDGAADLFLTVNKDAHLYQARAVPARVVPPVYELPIRALSEPRAREERTREERARTERLAYADLHHRLIEQYGPPSLVANEEYDVVHVTEGAARYLQFTGGEPSLNLLKAIRPELRLELSSALYQSAQNRTNVTARGLRVGTGDGAQTINLLVRPVLREDDTARGFFLVMFEEAEADAEGAIPTELVAPVEPAALHFEEELRRVKAQLRLNVEQYETQAEEMKASNEELQAMNEELRSSSEELETGKEELQSVNEEMTTVNQELKIKIEELNQSNNDFRNLMSSTDIGTIFLDRSLRIKLFTPRALNIFNLIPADAGRSLHDITSNLAHDGLFADVENVLERLQTVEREVETRDGRGYMMRLLPYRTAEDRIEGVVMTFIDISERKRAEVAVRASEERLQRAINIETVGVIFFDNSLKITDCNEAFVRMSGYTREEIREGKFSWEAFTPDGFFEASGHAIAEMMATGITTPYEKEYVRKDGSRFWALFAAKRIGENEIVEFVTDITEQKRAEVAVRRSEEKYRSLFDSIDEGFCLLERVGGEPIDFRYLEANPAFAQQIGVGGVVGKTIREMFPGAPEEGYELYERVWQTGVPERAEIDVPSINHFIELYAFPVEDGASRCLAVVFQDITERKRTEANLAFLAEVSQDLVRLTNIDETMESLSRKIGEYFKVSRVNFAAINEAAETAVITHEWHAEGLADIAGNRVHRLGDFISGEFFQATRAGEMMVVRDTREDARTTDAAYAPLGTRAFVTMPFVRGGQWLSLMSIDNCEPRDWREDEIELMGEITSRIWTRLERARAEEALREKDLELDAIINETPFMLTRCTADLRYRYVSRAYAAMLRRTPEEINGKPIIEVMGEEGWNTVAPHVERVLQGERVEYEDKVGFRGTAEPYLHVVYMPDTDEQGNVNGWFASIVDITERRRAEEALRESEGRLRALVENLPGGAVFVVDRDLRYLVAEGEALAVAGFKPEDLIGRSIFEALPPALAAEYEPIYRQALAGEPYEHEHEAHDRSYISRGVPLAGTDGRIYAVLAISYDITERKRAEEALRESEERLRLVVESVEDYAIFTMDTEGSINSWNAGAERTFGYTEEEAIGQHAEIIFTPEDRERGVPEEEMRQARETGRASDERWHLSKRGVRFYMSGVMAPLRDDDGELTGYAKIARDLTERKEMEDAIRLAHDELEERVRERTAELQEMTGELLKEVRERTAAEARVRKLLRQLVTVQEDERRRIARELHDTLGQQLAALQLSIGLLSSKADAGSGLREEAERTQGIFNQLNSDVDFLAWELRPAALDHIGLDAALQSFVREWSEHFGVKAGYSGFEKDAPRLPAEVETNLYRILQEALQNVHKHAGADRVDVVLDRRDGQVVLIIEDNGRGYDPEGEEAAGTNKGMGVTNMRERAALVGGEFEIESEPGAGVTIFIRVPVADPENGGDSDEQ